MTGNKTEDFCLFVFEITQLKQENVILSLLHFVVWFCFPVGEQRSSLCSMVKKEQTKTGYSQGKQFTSV